MKNVKRNFEDGLVVVSFAKFVKDLTDRTTQFKKNKENMDYLEECYIEYINDNIKPKYSVSTFKDALKIAEQIMCRNYYLNNREHILDNVNSHQVKLRLKMANRHASEEEINKMLESELKRIKDTRLLNEKQVEETVFYNTFDSRSPGFSIDKFAKAVKEKEQQNQRDAKSVVSVKEFHNQQKAKAKLVKVSDNKGNLVVGNDIESVKFATGGGASIVPSTEECNVVLAKPKEATPMPSELKLIPHKELITKWLKLNMEPDIFVPGNILALPAFVEKYKEVLITQWKIDPSIYGVNRLLGDLYFEYLDICQQKNETK